MDFGALTETILVRLVSPRNYMPQSRAYASPAPLGSPGVVVDEHDVTAADVRIALNNLVFARAAHQGAMLTARMALDARLRRIKSSVADLVAAARARRAVAHR